MTMPHADDAPGDAALIPHENDEAVVEPPSRDEAGLSVVLRSSDRVKCKPRKDFPRPGHVKPALLQRLLVFRRVAGDAHGLIVAT
jgi:hypothetical protein